MIKSDKGSVKIVGSREDIKADYGCIYSSMLQLFSDKELKEIHKKVIEHKLNELNDILEGWENGKYNL